jgi:hypothetical protein
MVPSVSLANPNLTVHSGGHRRAVDTGLQRQISNSGKIPFLHTTASMSRLRVMIRGRLVALEDPTYREP